MPKGGDNLSPPFQWILREANSVLKENLRDNMTNVEIALNILAEASATELSKEKNPQGFDQQKHIAKAGGSVAKAAKNQLESQLGHSVISPAKATDYILPQGEEE